MVVVDYHHHDKLIMQKSMKKKGKPFSLESYLAYLHSRDFANFTVNHLNLVISIHGFKKYQNRKLAEEAVRAIEPTDPVRSTLNEEISSSPLKASITYEDALKDLKALNWQECSITSMRSIKQDNGTDLVTVPPSSAIATLKSQKAAKKRKTGSLMSNDNHPNKIAPLMSASSDPSKSDGSSIVPPSSAIAKSKSQKAAKKRKTGSLMSNDSHPSKIAPLMSASSDPSKSDGSNTYSIVPVFPTKTTNKMRSQKGMKKPMLASSTSCTSGPRNSSSSDGCVSLAVMTESSN